MGSQWNDWKKKKKKIALGFIGVIFKFSFTREIDRDPRWRFVDMKNYFKPQMHSASYLSKAVVLVFGFVFYCCIRFDFWEWIFGKNFHLICGRQNDFMPVFGPKFVVKCAAKIWKSVDK